jgi:ubiquinone/menaquinone biosynthesis C-methylase UbiE
MRVYSDEPKDHEAFQKSFDRFYTHFAPVYDVLVKTLPQWKKWLRQAIPYLQGPRVLEVSFGTGFLMTQYAGQFETSGIDLNAKMVTTATKNLARAGLQANLRQGSVEALPYPDEQFNTVLCTMAFSGYPDGHQALSEMLRVVAPDGRLVIVDINYPTDGNRRGTYVTKGWMRSGDVIRDMDALFRGFELPYVDLEIGGWGSVHLYVAAKRQEALP